VFTEPELREVVAGSRCYAEVLRKLGRRPAGGNHGTIKKYVARWGISTEHFDQDAIRREALSRPRYRSLTSSSSTRPITAAI
jgi:hypothetical protein